MGTTSTPLPLDYHVKQASFNLVLNKGRAESVTLTDGGMRSAAEIADAQMFGGEPDNPRVLPEVRLIDPTGKCVRVQISHVPGKKQEIIAV